PVLSYTGNTSICYGESTRITVSGASSYSWGNASSSSLFITPKQDTTLTVTGTMQGCYSTLEIPIAVKALPSVYISGVDAICSGDAATLTANGADTYLWKDAASSTTTSVSISPLYTSIYRVTGTANNGCSSDAEFTLSVNPLPIISINAPNSVCNGAIATLSASGANSYIWNGNIPGANYQPNITNDSTFTVIGTDLNNCQSSATKTITKIDLPTLTYTGNDNICLGETSRITVHGANTYKWNDNSVGSMVSLIPKQDTLLTVYGTAQNCSSSIEISITVMPLPSVYISGTNAICFGDETTLTANGADTYLWKDAASHTDKQITVSPLSTMRYIVSGTNANGCSSDADFTLTVNSLPEISINAPNGICEGSTAILSASGAASYIWNGIITGANYQAVITKDSVFTVVGTDINNCRSSASTTVLRLSIPELSYTGETTVCYGEKVILQADGANAYQWHDGTINSNYVATPEYSTTYSFTGTTQGCSAQITIPIVVKPLPVIEIIGKNEICMLESTNLTTQGKVSSYKWNTGDLTQSIEVSPFVTTDYIVTGTADNGCASTDTFRVKINVLPHITIDGTRDICYDGFTELKANGGSYYLWDGNYAGNTLYPHISNDSTFTVVGYDDKGCQNKASFDIHCLPIPELKAHGSDSVCVNEEVTIRMSGASSYEWHDGSKNDYYTTISEPGTEFWVTGTLNGCENTLYIPIYSKSAPTIWVDGKKSVCKGDSLTLTAKGADTYRWSNEVYEDIVVISPNYSTQYSVVGIGENGCSNTYTFDVTVNQLPTITITGDDDICRDGLATLNASGAETYHWDDAATSSGPTMKAILSQSRTFKVVGTDNLGCSNYASHYVYVVQEPNVSFDGDTITCLGDSIILLGQGAASYNWTYNGDTLSTSPVLKLKPGGNQVIRLSGSLQKCTASRDIRINVKTPPTVHITGDAIVCPGIPFRLAASGAESYIWYSGERTSLITDSIRKHQHYGVTGIAANGCHDYAEYEVNVYDVSKLILQTDYKKACPEEPDTVIMRVSGGNEYTWESIPFISEVAYNSADQLLLDFDETTLIRVRATDFNGCSTNEDSVLLVPQARDSIRFEVYPTYIEEGNSQVRLTGITPTNTTWNWNMDDDSDVLVGNNLTYNYNIAGKDSFLISIVATDAYGCVYTGEQAVYTWRDFWAPNAFTPDGNELNDSFGFKAREYFTKFEFIIYNRLGEIIYSGKSIADRWDGNYKGVPCPWGVYGWVVNYTSDYKGVVKSGTKKGFVTIVR
ncbi:MAG: gliding motility-associated C-terminal domain-containing protein, partial [Bacteroidia bacterium]|nr:gliding motility-associated C-terminal domain-containing protein [Bacteroidia bacterium]